MPDYLLAKLVYFTKCAEQGLNASLNSFPRLLHYTEPPCFHFKTVQTSFSSGVWWKYPTDSAYKGSSCTGGTLSARASLLDDATYGQLTQSSSRQLHCTLL